MTTARFEAIDGLRGAAIVLVVMYHLWLVYGIDAGVVSRVGFLGVDLFFALSGFCIFFPYARAHFERSKRPSLGEYARKRAGKILPSYLLALGIFAIVFAARNGAAPALSAFAAHAFFLHPFFPDQFQSISGPLWTIGVEVQFYFIFPLAAAAFAKRPALAIVALAATALGYRALVVALGAASQMFWSNQVLAFLDVFAAGMLAAYAVAWYRSRRGGAAAAHIAGAVFIAAIVAAAIGAIALSRSSAMTNDADFFVWQNHWRGAIAALLFPIVAAGAIAAPPIRTIAGNRALAFLAVVSYNLYLWHLEILAYGSHAGAPAPVAVAAALLVAAAATFWIELPLLKRFARSAAMSAPAAAEEPSRALALAGRGDFLYLRGPYTRAEGTTARRLDHCGHRR